MTMMCMAALLLMAVSCKKEKANEEYTGEGFRATTESHTGDGDSKTQLLDLSVTWCSGDEIKVFNSDSEGKKFSAANAGTTADLNPVPGEGVTDAFFTPPYTAFYPYDPETGINQIYLKGTQRYTTFDDGNGNKVLTFASGENPMAAKSSNKVLPFKNLCGILKFQLYSASSCTVKSIRVTSLKSGEQLWGTGTVTFDGTDATLGTLANGGQSIILDCGANGVGLSINEGAPTEFMVVIPDGALSQGFMVTVTDKNDNVWSKTTTANNMITKSKIKAMPKQAVTTHTPVSPSTVTVTAGCVSCTYSAGGTVTVPSGGPHTCEYGLVYCPTSADHNPTVADSKIVVNTETFSDRKTFTADLGVLENGVEYKVRAYAMIEGVTYSTEVKTVTGGDGPLPLPSSWPNGKSPYAFTVGTDGGKPRIVYFSQGNLQYNATGSSAEVALGENVGGTWRFAEHQFDFIGADNANAAQTYDGWIDLFGWGTSGYNHNDRSYQPWSTIAANSRYYAYSTYTDTYNLYDQSGKADWGYNAISNGGNTAGIWRTLTGGNNDNGGEWAYLISRRTNASKLYGEGKVGNCTPGLIILPDDWSWTGDVAEFGPNVEDESRKWKSGRSDWSNEYSYSDWAKMEAAGAVFLPAANARVNTSLYYENPVGAYWSSSFRTSDVSYSLNFYSGGVDPVENKYGRCHGHSVRLVTDVPNASNGGSATDFGSDNWQ